MNFYYLDIPLSSSLEVSSILDSVPPSKPLFLQTWYFSTLAIISCILIIPIFVFAVLTYQYYTKLSEFNANINLTSAFDNILKSMEGRNVPEGKLKTTTRNLYQYENETQTQKKQPDQDLLKKPSAISRNELPI